MLPLRVVTMTNHLEFRVKGLRFYLEMLAEEDMHPYLVDGNILRSYLIQSIKTSSYL